MRLRWHKSPRRSAHKISTDSLARGAGLLQQRWESKRRSLVRICVLALVAWGSYAAIASDHGLLCLWQLKQEERSLDRELAVRKAELQDLRARMDEPALVRGERTLREKFRLSRADEIVYFFERVEPGTTPLADSAAIHGAR